MRKQLFFMFVLALLTITISSLATANYLVYNGSKDETAEVVYAYYDPGGNSVDDSTVSTVSVYRPSGFRVSGYYKVRPGSFLDLGVPNKTEDVYVRITRAGLIRPRNHEKRDSYSLHIHPTKAFSLLESGSGRILEVPNGISRSELVNTGGFYKYSNGGTFTLNGPLKYGVKTIDFYVGGDKKWGGSWRYWKRTFTLPGKVLFSRNTKARSYGRGGAHLDGITTNGSTITANGRIEDGRVIRGQLDVAIRVYYRK